MTTISQPRRKRVVGLGGTFRAASSSAASSSAASSSAASSSERIVRAVLAQCAALGAEVTMFDGPSLARLPHFNPENPDRTAEEQALVAAVRDCDALVIGSPGYHGGYSGLVKNAIDLLEDLRADERVYFDGRPVGLVVTAAGWQACGTTLSALRDVVHAMRGWPTPVGVTVNSVEQRPFGPDGALADEGIARAVRAQAEQIMGFVFGAAA